MIIFFIIGLLPTVWLQDQQDQCPSGSCNPQLGDLMVGRAAQLSASSTCGLDGPHNYCIIGYLEVRGHSERANNKLSTEATDTFMSFSGRSMEEQKCFTCDSRLPYNRYGNPNSHRIENIITTFDPERKMKWWQSENGVHQVSIQLDLETMFQFSHLVLTFKSFRPAAMLVERSKDFGRSWKVFRYFAEDCMLYFPSVSDQTANSIDDVVCDSRYSGSEPSSDGEVVLKALDPVFEIENPYSPQIQELITMTNIRVNFTRLFTLGDTLLGRRRRNAQDKYYYALYNMVIRGSCFCNGHASQCMPLDGGRGCQCHGHSDSCHFDAARFEATGGVSGGVCDDCRHDRVGPQCEQCRSFLYQDPQRVLDDPYGCIPCDCDPTGSQGGLCDPLSGQCVCKENVEGRRCDRCKHGFFDLRQDDPTGCQVCRCHVLGSVGSCDQLTGNCKCDHLASGTLCERCVAGFWGLGDSGFRCSPCDCDMGGAHSITCSPHDGQCHCLPNMVGRRCTDPAPGHFLPPLDYFLYEAELAAPLVGISSSSTLLSRTSSSSSSSLLMPDCEQYFRQQGYDFKFSNGRVVVVRRTRHARRRRQQSSIPLESGHALQIIPRQRLPDQPITWTGLGLVRVLDGAGLRFTVDNLPSSIDYQLVIRYEPETPSDWLSSVNIIMLSPGDGSCSNDPTGSKTMILPGNSRGSILDPAVCLNAGGRYFVDITFNKQHGSEGSHILIDSMGLIPNLESISDFCSKNDLDSFRRFRCIGFAVELGSEELLSEVCEGLIRSMSARIHNGAVLCRCNVIGSLGPSCSKVGGLCECKPNVIGRCCDTCAPLTFGFGLDGCKPCECDPRGSVSELCDQVRGQCACRSEVTGRRCGHCRMGFWGFPHCRPCECNGLSEVCDEQSGECLNCREHATGPHCDRCSPGFYGDLTLPGVRCEKCFCNNNIDPDDHDACDSVTGECLHCLHNTTGPRCQNCKLGYYGNALDQECKACDCNMEGTLRPSCDPETGECMCRVGVTGIFCDECAPGYDSTFPTCEECHPCAALWAENVTDVQRAAQRMRTFIPLHGDDLQPGHGHHQQRILEMHSKLEGLTNLTGLSPLKVEKVEKLYLKIRKLKDSIDPNMILINPYSLLNTEIDNIHHDFKQLLNNLMEKLMKQLDDDYDDEDLEDLSDEVHKLYDSFLSDEKRVRNANEALEDSMTTRQEVKHKLSMCSSRGDMAPLEKIVKALSVVNLNRMICGGPGLEDCSGCGGALCRLPLGNRKCGGPNCDGIVPFSVKASETAEKVKDKLIMFPIIDVQQVTQDTKALTKDLHDRINNNMDTFERDKNKTKELIQRVKDYLLGQCSISVSINEMVPPEDIEKMARAVLDIQLPRSPDEIRSMINDINNLLSNATNFPNDLKNLEEQAKTAQDLLQKARELKELTKDIDVTEISNDIYGAEKAQDIANDDLETASQDRDTTKDQIREITDKLDDTELKLMSRQPKELLDNIDALKKKTEQNREKAREAREAADSATDTTTDTQMELDDVSKLFDVLKQKNKNQTVQDEAGKRLKNIIGEAETLKRQVEDKLRLVQDVEEKIQKLINSKEQKAAEVAILLETVDSLRKEISKRAEEYISCSS
ncbi:hypothetical protein PAMP_020344 [Pampus punctatissimus]